MLEQLSDTFEAFAGGKGMDNRAFVKCLRDSLLIDQHFKTSDADLIFAQFRPKGGRHIDIIGFMRALVSVANRRRATERDVVAMILAVKGPRYQGSTDGMYPSSDDEGRADTKRPLPRLLGNSPQNTSSEEEKERVSPPAARRAPVGSASARPEQPRDSSSPMRVRRSGPERFYYDKTTYTGTSRNGGPTTDERPLDERPFAQRGPSPERRQSLASVAGSTRSNVRPKPTQLGLGLGSECSFDSRRQSVDRRMRAVSAEPSYDGLSPEPSMRSLSRGPERFYYDKTTYTGTWRHGGPTSMGSGLSRTNSPDMWAERWAASRDSLSGPATPLGSSVECAPRGAASQERMRTLHEPNVNLSRVESSRQSRSPSKRGPERFFYDKSTYTGTWKHGGPTTMGSGLDQKDGYIDLSELVSRTHVMDDALQRKRREGSPMNSVMGSVIGSQGPSPRQRMVNPVDQEAGLEAAGATAGPRGIQTPQLGGSIVSAAASSRGGSIISAAAPSRRGSIASAAAALAPAPENAAQWTATPDHPGRTWKQWVQPPAWAAQ